MGNNLSYSRINTYQECSWKYHIHYVEGIRPEMTKSSLAFGKSIDDGLNALLLTKNLSAAIIAFTDSWSQNKGNGLIQYSKSDFDPDFIDVTESSQEASWTCLYYKGIKILTEYNKQIIPKIKRVIEVQQLVYAENETGDSINGALDAIVEWEDGKVYLVDNKTTSVRYKENSANESEQLALYHFIKKNEPGMKIDGVAFIVMNKNLNKINVKTCSKCESVARGKSIKTCNQIINDVRCDGELVQSYEYAVEIYTVFGKASEEVEQQILNKFDQVNQDIKDKKFEKNYDACNSKYGKCAYSNYCRFGEMDGYRKESNSK